MYVDFASAALSRAEVAQIPTPAVAASATRIVASSFMYFIVCLLSRPDSGGVRRLHPGRARLQAESATGRRSGERKWSDRCDEPRLPRTRRMRRGSWWRVAAGGRDWRA